MYLCVMCIIPLFRCNFLHALSLLGAVDGGGFFWVPCVCGCCCHTYSNLIIYFQHSLSLRKSEKPCNNRIEEQCGEMASTFNARRALIRNFFAQCPVVAAVCLNYISQNVKLFTLCRESTYCSNKPFIVIANIEKKKVILKRKKQWRKWYLLRGQN